MLLLELTVSDAQVFSFLALIGVAAKMFWTWLTAQFEYLKTKIDSMEEKMDQERDSQDARFDGLLERLLDKMDKRIETERVKHNGKKRTT